MKGGMGRLKEIKIEMRMEEVVMIIDLMEMVRSKKEDKKRKLSLKMKMNNEVDKGSRKEIMKIDEEVDKEGRKEDG